MKLEVLFTAEAAERFDFSGYLAIIVDVLRATTTITAALETGARGIYPASTVEQAREMQRLMDAPLLCGERDGYRIDGFDYGNSPVEIAMADITGRDLILTTTNGTRAVYAAQSAEVLVAACMQNADAVSRYVREALLGEGLAGGGGVLRQGGELHEGVAVVCSGTDGQFSLDDTYVAGIIVANLASDADEVSDAARAAAMLPLRPMHEVVNSRTCRHVRVLHEKGFDADVRFAFQPDFSTIIPVYREGAFSAASTELS